MHRTFLLALLLASCRAPAGEAPPEPRTATVEPAAKGVKLPAKRPRGDKQVLSLLADMPKTDDERIAERWLSLGFKADMGEVTEKSLTSLRIEDQAPDPGPLVSHFRDQFLAAGWEEGQAAGGSTGVVLFKEKTALSIEPGKGLDGRAAVLLRIGPRTDPGGG